jgi:hypothetical protein
VTVNLRNMDRTALKLLAGLMFTVFSITPDAAQEKKNAAAKEEPDTSQVLRAPEQINPKLPPEKPKGSCHVNGELPDPKCTPGVADASISQANIQETICLPGYSKDLRSKYSPVKYEDAIKRQQIREYGYQDTRPSSYEEDHLISIELEGHRTDPRNLWPEFPHSPNAKDKVEDELHKKVCSGQMTLAEAQRIISTDWTKAK